VVEADTINILKNLLDKHWLNQAVLFNFNADLTGSGSVPIWMWTWLQDAGRGFHLRPWYLIGLDWIAPPPADLELATVLNSTQRILVIVETKSSLLTYCVNSQFKLNFIQWPYRELGTHLGRSLPCTIVLWRRADVSGESHSRRGRGGEWRHGDVTVLERADWWRRCDVTGCQERGGVASSWARDRLCIADTQLNAMHPVFAARLEKYHIHLFAEEKRPQLKRSQ